MLPGSFHTNCAGVSFFSSGFIFTQGLAHRVRRPLNIQQIIDDLELQSDRFAIPRKQLNCLIGGTNRNCTHSAACSEQCARLVPVNTLNGLQLCQIVTHSPQSVVDLSLNHCSGSVCKLSPKPDRDQGVWMLQSRFIRQRQQRIARENSHGFSCVSVQGGASASDIVVIQGRQIVMNQTEGMDHLDGCSSVERNLTRLTTRDCTEPGERRADSFTPTKQAIADRLVKILGQVPLLEKSGEMRINTLNHVSECWLRDPMGVGVIHARS